MRREVPPSGCIIVFLFSLILAGAVVVAFVLALGNLADARAGLEYERGRSTALIIQANGQARLDAAQALAMVMVASLPWGVLGVLGLLALAIVAMVGFLAWTRVQADPGGASPVRIIERQLILIPAPGCSRREVWKSVVSGDLLPIREVNVEAVESDSIT